MILRWGCRQRLSGGKTCCPKTRLSSVSSGISLSHRKYATRAEQDAANATIALTRNIGIIAHIDAGKTTTTERMLYYSGYTRRIGDVDEGSTVTDFLPAERARGITIQSAAISFKWPPTQAQKVTSDTGDIPSPRSSTPHNINLIDTPGHADFTFEVLRSLRVLDGAVCILDGVAGVEAQTEKVWAQASTYRIPRIVFVNKLDRDGARFSRTVKEIGARLNAWPAVCGIPWWNDEGKLIGVGDVVGLRGLRYIPGGDGKEFEVFNLQQLESKDVKLEGELDKARLALTELLSEHDDVLVEKYLEAEEDHLAIPSQHVIESLRRCALRHPQRVVPVFAGASFRNVGVQPLLDAIVDFLPSPNERPDPEISFGSSSATGGLADLLTGKLQIGAFESQSSKKLTRRDKANYALQNIEACALAFKVVADAKRGVLVYIRVYSGTVSRNAALWNTNMQTTERAQRLLKMYANEAVDVESIQAGQIGVLPALKFARTGDTLISYAGANPKVGPPTPVSSLHLRPIEVPPPVFFVSVEANNLGEEKHIKESLDLLLREDPSLHVSVDEESGQTHLAGMGELHLEIARDKLVNDLKAKARIGSIEIGYREAVTASSPDVTEVVNREVGGKSSKAACLASVEPALEGEIQRTDEHVHALKLVDGNILIVSMPTLHSDGTSVDAEKQALPENLPIGAVLQAFQTGALAATVRGPTHGYPVHSTQIRINFDPEKHVFHNTTPVALSSATRRAIQQALKDSAAACQTAIMEPVMLVTISVDENNLGSVVHDISSARGGSVVSLGSEHTSEDNHKSIINVEKIYAPSDPFHGGLALVDNMTGIGSAMSQVVARVPLKEMVGYLKHLRSLTGGRGTFTMAVDRFVKMSAQRQRAFLNEMRGEYG